MEKQWFQGVVALGAFLIVSAWIAPAVGGTNNLGGDERPVLEATGTPSFGTEDWTGPKEQAPVMAMPTPSFGRITSYNVCYTKLLRSLELAG